jgi:DNA excision repair protein ERCC-3
MALTREPAQKPLIVQSDRSILLDVHAETAEDARAAIMPFAELEKSPEHIHTYRITPISLWNAASSGLQAADVTAALQNNSRYDLPAGIIDNVTETMSRFGKIKMLPFSSTTASENGENASGHADELLLTCPYPEINAEIEAARPLQKLLTPTTDGFILKLQDRGTIKWELIKLGWPVEDEAPLKSGEPLDFAMRTGQTAAGKPFELRRYQIEAARAALGSDSAVQGYGVVVLPCGAGKTLVGMALMAALKTNTLILTTNTAAVHQWISELLDKSTLTKDQIAEYTGHSKASAPVTIATYQILTWRPQKNADFPHFKLFRERPWGLIIYDEVHLLPAPVFRITAELQAVRRIGLTATLIREDGAEYAVFSLVGPKRYDVPWKDMESLGWIAQAICTEIRAPLPPHLKIPYATAAKREKYRIASENPVKEDIVLQLIENHADDHILVIGQYLKQLESIAKTLCVPIITGKTSNIQREKIYAAFNKGDVRVIVVSKVANFAIDLPDASMAIQISGSFGSRQEEAQRLGRILRPKKRNSNFYTVVSRNTVEEDFAQGRQQFLTEQGYKYSVRYWE